QQKHLSSPPLPTADRHRKGFSDAILINSNYPITKKFLTVWNLDIGYYLVIGLPARSPASRSLAEGRRFGEGRCLVIGA
ncbi:MAG: hypothetical protein Q8N70_06695, partial [Deltaproteobacteria bacterium]|nr:hypothetical protein [Deltaproteobacteria bacterium]